VKILGETTPLFLVGFPQLDGEVSQALVRPAVSFLERMALYGVMLRVTGEKRELIDRGPLNKSVGPIDMAVTIRHQVGKTAFNIKANGCRGTL